MTSTSSRRNFFKALIIFIMTLHCSESFRFKSLDFDQDSGRNSSPSTDLPLITHERQSTVSTTAHSELEGRETTPSSPAPPEDATGVDDDRTTRSDASTLPPLPDAAARRSSADGSASPHSGAIQHPQPYSAVEPSPEEILAMLDNFTCDSLWSCRDVYAAPRNFSIRYYDSINCACDGLCHVFKDCCSDAQDPGPSAQGGLEAWLPYVLCDKMPGVERGGFVHYVGLCPSAWADQVTRTRCETPNSRVALEATPASDVRSGLTFRNVFCGLCHRQNVTIWMANVSFSSELSLPKDVTLDSILQRSRYDVEFFPPPNYEFPRPCIKELRPPDCLAAQEGTVIQKRCQTAYINMVYRGFTPFRSIYCAACTFTDTKMVFDGLLCRPLRQMINRHTPHMYSLSMLFDMNIGQGGNSVGFGTAKQQSDNAVESCQEDEVYDPAEDTCRAIVCAPGYVFANGSCVTNFTAPTLRTDISSPTDCPRIAIDESEFAILPDGRLFVNSSGTIYNLTDYIVDGSTAYVCTNLTRNRKATTVWADKIEMKFSLTEAVVSTVCLGLSVTALLALLTVYSCFRTLRNTPGCILMSLALALLAAKTTMLVAPAAAAVASVCRAVGATMHLLFLASFFWMNVMAVDVCRTFSKTFVRVEENGRSWRTFLLYSLYAWGAPLAIVASALALDHWGPSSSNLRPGYGEGLCWITSKKALLVFFASPLLLLIAANIVLFIHATRNICSTQIPTQQGGQLFPKRSRLAVCARLTVVTGSAWTFGLLAAFLPLAPLWYVFIAANALQGVFLFVSFALTPRVLALASARRQRGPHSPKSAEACVSTTQLSVYSVHSAQYAVSRLPD